MLLKRSKFEGLNDELDGPFITKAGVDRVRGNYRSWKLLYTVNLKISASMLCIAGFFLFQELFKDDEIFKTISTLLSLLSLAHVSWSLLRYKQLSILSKDYPWIENSNDTSWRDFK